jgi:hypothetical protein
MLLQIQVKQVKQQNVGGSKCCVVRQTIYANKHLHYGFLLHFQRQQEDLVVVITFGNMTFQEHMHILRSISSASKGHEDDEMMT